MNPFTKIINDLYKLPPEPNLPDFVRATEVEASELLASDFHKRLMERIAAFEKSLDSQHEVGMGLVSFGPAVVLRLESIDFLDPALRCFQGRGKEDEPLELIQHVSQISLLLMRLPALDPERPRRIGFHED